MRDNQLAQGYLICHQCIVGKKVMRQMRPLSDWSEHEWYPEACSTKTPPKPKATKSHKKPNSKKSRGPAGKREVS